MIATRSILNRHQPATDCPFCLANDLIPREKILKQAKWANMVLEYGQAIPGTRQIVPVWHEMTVLRWLLFLWSLFWLVVNNPLRHNFNLSINFGADAGQTLPHIHVWLIPRSGEFAGKGHAYYIALDARVRRELKMTLAELVESQLSTKR